MVKRILLAILAVLLGAAPASAAPQVVKDNSAAASTIYTITFRTGDTADSDALRVNGTCAVRYSQVSGDDASLYAIPTVSTAAASGTLLTALTSSTTTAVTFQAGTLWVKAVATDATAGGSVMVIHCSNAQVAAGGATATQPTPTAYTESTGTSARITDPATATYGYKLMFSDNPVSGFSAKTYPGGATTGNEPDNQIGITYNKGLDALPDNQYEHAWDDSWELSYRDTTGTYDETWVERNFDVYPATNSATLTSIGGGFNPAVGSYVTFSGGGTGRVLAWSSPTLTWNQFFGTTAAGETVAEAATPTDTATVGTPSAVGSYNFRPYLHVWRTASNKASHQWSTEYGGRITMKLQNGGVGINTDDQVSATFEIHGANSWGRNILGTLSSDTTSGGAAADGYPAFWLQYEGELHPTSGNTAANAQWIRMDYLDLASSVSVVDYGKGLVIKTPLEPTNANDVYQAFGIVIESQRAAGNNHGAAISIESQTCVANAACTDGLKNNVEFVGGSYNTGHLSFAGQGESTDHIWRDDTNEVFRASTDDAPDSETDGRPIVTGTNSDVYGPTLWAISNASTFDSGTEVCAAAGVGMTCVDVMEFSTPATPTDSTCATTHSNGVKFFAMCK